MSQALSNLDDFPYPPHNLLHLPCNPDTAGKDDIDGLPIRAGIAHCWLHEMCAGNASQRNSRNSSPPPTPPQTTRSAF